MHEPGAKEFVAARNDGKGEYDFASLNVCSKEPKDAIIINPL